MISDHPMHTVSDRYFSGETVLRFQNTISSLANLTFGIGWSAAYPGGQSITGTRGGGSIIIHTAK